MLVVESLHEYTIRGFNIRFWQEEAELLNHYQNQSKQAIMTWLDTAPPLGGPTFLDLCKFLLALPYCNAVQVEDPLGSTALIYPDWP